MRIGIVNEPLAASLLRGALGRGGHQVVWIAGTMDQVEACCTAHRPDLVLVDVHLRVLDGLAAVTWLARRHQVPVLLTATDGADPARIFDALGHGAMDVVSLPLTPGTADAVERAIEGPLLAKLTTIGRLVESGPAASRAEAACPLVAIGASAGGPGALAVVLGALPRTLAAGVVVVQHLGEGFTDGIAEMLQRGTALEVRVAREGDRPRAGLVLVAGGEQHLVLKSPGRLGYTPEPAGAIYRPSIDVFFDSVCRVWRGPAMGVLLTGMGRDGAAGLKAMRTAGLHTVTQDEATCAVYGMPKAAAAIDAAVEILSIGRIAGSVADWTASGQRERTPVRRTRG